MNPLIEFLIADRNLPSVSLGRRQMYPRIVGIHVPVPHEHRMGTFPNEITVLNSDFVLPAILVSPPLLLTAKVSQGAKVSLFALGSAKAPPGAPSLRHAELAQVVRVKEVFCEANGQASSSKVPSKSTDHRKGNRRDWLTLLVREALSKFFSALRPSSLYPCEFGID